MRGTSEWIVPAFLGTYEPLESPGHRLTEVWLERALSAYSLQSFEEPDRYLSAFIREDSECVEDPNLFCFSYVLGAY